MQMHLKTLKNLFKLLASIPKDKLLHSFYGVLIYAIVSFVDPGFAIVTTACVAVAREVWNETGFDWKDIGATVVIPIILFIKDMENTLW